MIVVQGKASGRFTGYYLTSPQLEPIIRFERGVGLPSPTPWQTATDDGSDIQPAAVRKNRWYPPKLMLCHDLTERSSDVRSDSCGVTGDHPLSTQTAATVMHSLWV